VKVLLDTNVILDVLLNRHPFSDDSAQLMAMVDRSEVQGFLCATTVTTIHYLLAKYLDSKRSIKQVRLLLSLFEIAPVNRVVLENALAGHSPDYEDAVIIEAAQHAGVEYIVTRNIKDFKKSLIPVYTPAGFIQALASLKQ